MGIRLSIGILVLIEFLSFGSLGAQVYSLESDDDLGQCERYLSLYNDSSLWQSAVEGLRNCLIVEGYLNYEEQLSQTDSLVSIRIQANDIWQLRFANDDYRTEGFESRSRRLDEMADIGYPFAQIVPDSIVTRSNEVEVFDRLEAGPFVLIDSLPILSKLEIPRGFLRYHFGLEVGQAFRQSRIDDLEIRARQLEFLQFQRPPALLFTKEGAWVYLYPEKQKANRFDLIVGFNNSPNEATRFSGQADIRLVNSLKKGEWIGVKWQAPPDGAQQLKLELGLPYLAGSRFWFEGELDFYRRDSSFINIDLSGKLRYAHKANAGVALVYRAQRSRLGVSGANEGLTALEKDLWGLELKVDQRNDVFSPNAGGLYRIEGSTGQRRSEGFRETQYRLDAEVDYFWGFAKRHIARGRVQAATLIGAELSTNELFRIGGRNSLRGFAEQSLFSSRYGIGTLEYRYQLESTTYFQVFGDGAVRQSIEGQTNEFYSLGAGLSLLLSSAYIQIDIGVPNSGDGFDFRGAVLHLGYAGRF
jgi:outer membrane protein assembly factor BamA